MTIFQRSTLQLTGPHKLIVHTQISDADATDAARKNAQSPKFRGPQIKWSSPRQLMVGMRITVHPKSLVGSCPRENITGHMSARAKHKVGWAGICGRWEVRSRLRQRGSVHWSIQRSRGLHCLFPITEQAQGPSAEITGPSMDR